MAERGYISKKILSYQMIGYEIWGLGKRLPYMVVESPLGVVPPNGWLTLGVGHPFILYFIFSIF
jgi:hypothetical protein